MACLFHAAGAGRSEAVLAELCLTLGIAIFSKSTAHGHFLRNLSVRVIQHRQGGLNSLTAFCPMSRADPLCLFYIALFTPMNSQQ
jgi:hypothetical protein